MPKSRWKNLKIIDGEVVETGEIVEEEFPTFIGYVADCYDVNTGITYKWNEKLGKYVKVVRQ